tara:strand:- start:599 stop:736 length:138 start_codon:yes stop_codon:yes gene_type:complete
MSLISLAIIVEISLLIVVAFWIKRQNSKPNRQPSLSKKIIKNLKL